MNTPGVAGRQLDVAGRADGSFDAALAERLRETVVGSDR